MSVKSSSVNFWPAALVLAVVTFSLYSFVLPAPFKVLDDQYSIVGNSAVREANVKEIFSTGFFGDRTFYRPLTALSFLLEYKLFGLDYFHFNLDNVILHILNALSVMLLVRTLTGNFLLSFGTALLFAVHPLQWEAVANISGRAILLSAFFTLNALNLFIRFDQTRKDTFLFGSLALFTVGILCKESTAILPIAIFIYCLTFHRPIKKDDPLWFPMALFFIVLVNYLILRRALGITELFVWNNLAEAGLGFMTFLSGVLTYLNLFIFPLDLHFDRSQVLFASWADPLVALTMLVYGSAIIYAVQKKFWRWNALVLFLIAWFWMCLAPVSQLATSLGVQPGVISLAEHFLYLPSLSIFFAIAYGFVRLKEFYPARRKMINTVAAVVLGFFMLLTVEQNLIALNEETMLKRSLAIQPFNSRLWFCLGMTQINQKQFAAGEAIFRRALQVDPQHVRSRIALGRSLCDQGRYLEGAAEYEKVREAKELKENLAANKKLAYEYLVKDYETKLTRAPNDADILFHLGVFQAQLGHIEPAMDYFRRVLEQKPNHPDALFNLATGFESLGNAAKAKELFEKFLELPDGKEELREYSRKAISRKL